MRVFLETPRLVLRWITRDDAENLYRLSSDPQVMRYISGGKPDSYRKIRDKVVPRLLGYYEKYDHYGSWAALEKPDLCFIGWFLFRPLRRIPEEIELGYRLHRFAWGKGYATEGSRALLEKGFREFGIQKVVAISLPQNTASIRVMEKVGLRFERRYLMREIGEVVVKYSLNKNAFFSSAFYSEI